VNVMGEVCVQGVAGGIDLAELKFLAGIYRHSNYCCVNYSATFSYLIYKFSVCVLVYVFYTL